VEVGRESPVKYRQERGEGYGGGKAVKPRRAKTFGKKDCRSLHICSAMQRGNANHIRHSEKEGRERDAEKGGDKRL